MHNYRYLITALLECLRACEHCSACALDGNDIYPLRLCIKLTMDCADTCILALRLLERDSMITNDILDVCIKIMRMCAVECEKFPEHPYCKECIEACRKAEKACLIQA